MFYFSLVLILIGTIFYDVLEKTFPHKVNYYLYLMITYLIAFICLVFGLMIGNYDIHKLWNDINIGSIVAGIAAMFVDFGLILSYQKGWSISALNITYSLSTYIILLIIGVMALNETLSSSKIVGFAFCALSIFLMNHKNEKKAKRR